MMTSIAILVMKAFGMLAAVLAALSCLTYSFFWYETAGSLHALELRRLSGGRMKRLFMKGICSSILSMGLTVFLYPLGFRRSKWYPQPDLKCAFPTIILIHGLYHNPSGWVLFKRHLMAAGFKNVYSLGYCSWNLSFDDLVRQLDEFVKNVTALVPDRPVVLLGHSLGGLLGRAYLSRTEDRGSLKGLVTLGTPHHGSRLAALGIGRLAQSLLYKGALIQGIEDAERARHPIHVPRLAFYSPLDNMVFPNAALVPDNDGWKVEVSDPVSHMSMLYHGPTLRRVVRALQEMCG